MIVSPPLPGRDRQREAQREPLRDGEEALRRRRGLHRAVRLQPLLPHVDSAHDHLRGAGAFLLCQ